ncbi:uncharacterized protein Ecym_5545 [Eremothecium cymbalariae DBVPG|uniref:Uncharacterized protein n=1 Tax=Eremothecium cymbalariae (strain CBS 270.75 / DBVPG 7215 / KCTC 17166 / NRRL Y-17582) TaxID=931890 RepID=I6NDZ3_ERECY|nr:hypothetical protein Ecym_5545 [Eremothecium cymbalariae DBVPG\
MKLSELTLIAAFASITYGSYLNQSLESDTLRTPIEHATGDATQVVDLPTIAAALPPDIQEYTASAFNWTVVANYEIYCPEPTTIITNDNTYVATEATTLTITDCPCTVPVVTPPVPSVIKPSTTAIPSKSAISSHPEVPSVSYPAPHENTTTEISWEVVTEFTTYCPEPTTIVTNDNTYVVTEATTLTITDCPCTVPVVTPPAPSIVVPSSSAVPPTFNASSTTAVKPSTSVVSPSEVPPVPYPVPHENTTTEISWEVVTEFTTYCPEPTTIVTNDNTYVVTEATTLTITDCPCTVPVVTPPAPSIVIPSSSAVPPTFNASSTTAVKPSTSVVSPSEVPPVPYPIPHENTTTEISWEVVTEFTTYCPEPTTIVTNDNTYVVTEATTLTISDCPCTVPVVTPPAPSVIKPSTTAIPSKSAISSHPEVPSVSYPAPHENTTTEISWEVVTEFTTYCPEPTTIVTNDNTYVVTEATTLTISDCPCTVPVVTPPAPSVIKPSTAVSSPPPAPPTPPTDTPLTPSTSSATVTLTPSIPSVKPSTTAASSPSSAPPVSPSAPTTTLVTSSNPPQSTTFEIQSVAGGSKLNVGFAGLVAIIAHFVQL